MGVNLWGTEINYGASKALCWWWNWKDSKERKLIIKNNNKKSTFPTVNCKVMLHSVVLWRALTGHWNPSNEAQWQLQKKKKAHKRAHTKTSGQSSALFYWNKGCECCSTRNSSATVHLHRAGRGESTPSCKNGLKIKVGSDTLHKHSTVIVTLTFGLNREYTGTFPATSTMLLLPMVLRVSALPW